MSTEEHSTEQSRLSLSEYSVKYNVSISTLRRRIRSGQLNFKLHCRKYFLEDKPLENDPVTSSEKAPPQTFSSDDLGENTAGSPADSSAWNLADSDTERKTENTAGNLVDSDTERKTENAAWNLVDSDTERKTEKETGKTMPETTNTIVAATEAESATAIKVETKAETEEGSLTVSLATKMLKEIKKSYGFVLKQKEEQILLLKEQIVDLKTLVNVLENQVEFQKTKSL